MFFDPLLFNDLSSPPSFNILNLSYYGRSGVQPLTSPSAIRALTAKLVFSSESFFFFPRSKDFSRFHSLVCILPPFFYPRRLFLPGSAPFLKSTYLFLSLEARFSPNLFSDLALFLFGFFLTSFFPSKPLELDLVLFPRILSGPPPVFSPFFG